MIGWLTAYSGGVALLVGAVTTLWGAAQWILTKAAERRKLRFDTYHSLVKDLCEGHEKGQPPRVDRQAATVFELRRFPEYYPASLRILVNLRSFWGQRLNGDPGFGSLRDEIESGVEFLDRRVSSRFYRLR